MCGIAGYFKGTYHSNTDSKELVKKMALAIRHRGSDSSGEWTDPEAGIALSHRRLSILDLSPAGHQPMMSPSARYVISFNGEIYNHLELRENLENVHWRGHSDTETLLAGFDDWGIAQTIKKTVGMFAIGVWDRKEKELILIRDRMGEKPLYYGWQGGSFIFASELKPFKVHPDFMGEIDRDSLALYLRHGYINAPYSIYQGIKKLIPGSILTLKGTVSTGEYPEPQKYWCLDEVVLSGRNNQFEGSDEEAVNELERVLMQSVKGQMISDVPLGAFLSGGIDSSTVVALMQAQSSKPVKTFSIGFNEKGYDEAVYAKAVARHLGTDHTELYVTPKEAMEVIPMLPSLYDEPFGDSSAIPTFLVSQLAKQHVTVSLSGDGGDELFGGYGRYASAEKLWNKISLIPYPLRKILSPLICFLAMDVGKPLIINAKNVLPNGFDYSNLDRAGALSKYLACKDEKEYYHTAVSSWRFPEKMVINGKEPVTPHTDRSDTLPFHSHTERMMYTDMLSYLPGDILAKIDRAAMGVSLETRVPLLDYRVVEFSWKLPFNMKVRDEQAKWILKEVLYKYVPKELLDRPKMGFGVPVDYWMKTDFREWGEELLTEKRLKEEGIFNSRMIRDKWQEHQTGIRNWKESLWFVLSFQAWKEYVND
ncbi:MAG TPA: asparagine synthase (glutamine-hydrolyzing) [Oligoflexia bacterium]|nr:asparagine synthase (glutamine-hydrolyzing) [Oligoflexia bacterium]HMP48565.1 asparagine synthase (glutamine-hydrolyzing) [Oligoflexia bacterium]